MSVAWVAGSVRAKALARRRLGADAARRLASLGSLDEALRMLSATSYGRAARPGQALAEAQHAVAAALLWNLRVLAGWLPPGGVGLLRALAGWFEIANTDELLLTVLGGQGGRAFQLGALATAWPRLRGARSLAGLRSALAGSAWGDPGGDSSLAIRFGMRARWAARVAGYPGQARTWACGGAALLVAGERLVAGRQIQAAAIPLLRGLIGPAAMAAGTCEELAAVLPSAARWALDGVHSPADLWLAEPRWWARVDRDGLTALRSPGNGSATVLGGAAVLAADAWRVRAALEIAARGGGPLEAYDAVA